MCVCPSKTINETRGRTWGKEVFTSDNKYIYFCSLLFHYENNFSFYDLRGSEIPTHLHAATINSKLKRGITNRGIVSENVYFLQRIFWEQRNKIERISRSENVDLRSRMFINMKPACSTGGVIKWPCLSPKEACVGPYKLIFFSIINKLYPDCLKWVVYEVYWDLFSRFSTYTLI